MEILRKNPFILSFVINFWNFGKKVTFCKKCIKISQKQLNLNKFSFHILNPWVLRNSRQGGDHQICEEKAKSLHLTPHPQFISSDTTFNTYSLIVSKLCAVCYVLCVLTVYCQAHALTAPSVAALAERIAFSLGQPPFCSMKGNSVSLLLCQITLFLLTYFILHFSLTTWPNTHPKAFICYVN